MAVVGVLILLFLAEESTGNPCTPYTSLTNIVDPTDPTCTTFITCLNKASVGAPTACGVGTKFSFALQESVQQSHLSSQFLFQWCNLLQLLNTQKNVPFHLNLHLNLTFCGVQNKFQMGNDSPHLSPNLHFNLKIEMLKGKLRSEMVLLNTL